MPPVCDDGLSPPCDDNGPAPSAGCPERAPEDQGEHYRVTFPGGTVYKLEKRVGYQYTGNGYLKNADRAGFYTTRITDPAGNAIYVSYDNANTRFPEAITRVWSSARHGVGDMDIQLQSCVTNDPSPQCPVGSEGALKRIIATGFKGDRSGPQTTVFDYSYQVIALDDEINGTGTPKRVDLPFLVSVAVNGYAPGGATITAPGGTTTYRYTTETNPGPHTARLLDRIGYPTGAVSLYSYGEWTSGQRAGSGTAKLARAKTGVITRTLYPEGDVPIDPDGTSGPLTAMAVRSQWVWERDFRRTDPAVACADPLDTTGPDVDDRVMRTIGPTGLVVEETWGGNPCGSHASGWEAIGAVVESALRPSRGMAPIRSEEIAHSSIDSTVDGEPVQTIVEKAITTLHDDVGSCFGESDSPGSPRKVVAENGSRTGNRWSSTTIRNPTVSPGYLPTRGGQAVQYRTERTFGSGSCFANRNMPYPLEELKQIEDSGGADVWRDENYEWICSEDPLNPDYAKSGLPSRSSSPWDWNPATGAPSVVVSSTYDAHRQQVQSTLTGSLGYGAGGAGGPQPNTYRTEATYDRGTQVNSTILDGTSPYLRAFDLELDGSSGSGNGAPWKFRSPTGINGTPPALETKLDFDALGRPTQIAPPTPEASITTTYLSLNEVQTVRGGSSGNTFNPGDPQQQFEKTQLDGLGRPIRTWRAVSGGSLATQITRFDELGRAVFVSEWMGDNEYSAASKIVWDVDRDGTSGAEYRVTDIPLTSDGKPHGTSYFYGAPLGGANPLQIAADGLGRLVRVERGGELVAQTTYCGLHREDLHRADLDADGTPEDVRYRSYHDGLGRLVLVDAPPLADQTGDGTNESADAEYSYNLLGNLTEVRLFARFAAHPFANWKSGANLDADGVPDQVRTFTFDALGRMTGRSIPEEDASTTPADLTRTLSRSFGAFDAAGNVLRWQDAAARKRDYYFRNQFDPAGRLIKVEKVKGEPSSTSPTDEDRLSGAGSFEAGLAGWETGTIDSGFQFTPSGTTYWKAANYSGHPCTIGAAPLPGGAANGKGLWFGQSTLCSYDDAPATPEVLRRYVTGVTRDDTLTFQLWRQTREGETSHDQFTVYIVRTDGATADMSPRRTIWRMDGAQRSWSRWQRVFDIRPADLFTQAEWPERQTHGLYLVLVFEKKTAGSTGINGGLMVDNIFLGRRGIETLAELKYDEALCASAAPALVTGACEDASEPYDRATGQPTTVTGFRGGVAVDRRRFIYRGMNGRISSEEHAIDWTGSEFLDQNSGSMRWVTRWGHDNNGETSSIVYPYQPGFDAVRRYLYTLDRSQVVGIHEGTESIPFLAGDPAPVFDAVGNLTQRKFTNGTRQSFAFDPFHHLTSISAEGPADNGIGFQSLWSSGTYRHDPVGNITAIGQQLYQYDEAGRLTRAEIQPQASAPGVAAEEVVDFQYDPFGNARRSTAQPGGPMTTDPIGLSFDHQFGPINRNRVVTDSSDFLYDFDPNGNMQRFRGKLDQPVKALWTDTNQMALFYEGDPAVATGRPGEAYLYDASGVRVVRQQVAHAGLPEFDLRDGSGQTLSRFIHDPGSPRPRLDRDYVYGAGLIERVVTAQPPTIGVQHPMISGSSVSLNSSTGVGTYSGDLATPSGWTNYVSGLTADASGNFLLPEAELRANEVNFLQLRKEGSSETGYSAPIALITDSTVTAGSANQVRAVSVHRVGNSVTIRWSLLTTNNKAFRLYFRRADNGTTYSLTPQGLPTGTRTVSLDSQALSAPCGSFFLTQIQSNGSDTAESAKADLPSPNSGAAGRLPCGGGSGTGPPPIYSWKNFVHFRDHLFSLRVLTDEAGESVQGTDFFPYGLELVPDGKAAGLLSRAKYTMHDRDEETGLDDMILRLKSTRGTGFLSADFVDDVGIGRPATWNRYSYVRGYPTVAVDPFGLMTKRECLEWRGEIRNGDSDGPSNNANTTYCCFDSSPESCTPIDDWETDGVEVEAEYPREFEFNLKAGWSGVFPVIWMNCPKPSISRKSTQEGAALEWLREHGLNPLSPEGWELAGKVASGLALGASATSDLITVAAGASTLATGGAAIPLTVPGVVGAAGIKLFGAAVGAAGNAAQTMGITPEMLKG